MCIEPSFLNRGIEIMSESKSNIISFRLPQNLQPLAQIAAVRAGDKNASAWCQKLVIEALSKTDELKENQISRQPPESFSVNELLKALSNLRQLNLDCFKMFSKDEEQYKEFLKVAITSEEDWLAITRDAGQTVDETADAPEATEERESCREPDQADDAEIREQGMIAKENFNEYDLFAEEMKNEIADFVGGNESLPTHPMTQTAVGESSSGPARLDGSPR